MKWALSILVFAAIAIFSGRVARAVDVTLTSTSGEAFPINTIVTFQAAATSTNSVTTYTWDFGDGTQTVVTMVPTVDHAFTTDNVYTVTVTVDNGIDPPASDFQFFEAIELPAPNAPFSTNEGDPVDLNPDAGFALTLNTAQSGYIDATLAVDSEHSSPTDSFETDFNDGVNGRDGIALLHRYMSPGVFILQSVHDQSGSSVGMLRKTLAFSELETLGAYSDPNVVDLPVAKRKLIFKRFSGRFYFKQSTANAARASSGNDVVAVTWQMTLPAGFDPKAQVPVIAIGNVKAGIPLKSNGAGIIAQPSPYSAVKFQFPHLTRGQLRPAKPFVSTVRVSMSSANLPAQGFDTEGISPDEFNSTHSRGPFFRRIQVAACFAGVSYSGVASVALRVSSNGAAGTIAVLKNHD